MSYAILITIFCIGWLRKNGKMLSSLDKPQNINNSPPVRMNEHKKKEEPKRTQIPFNSSPDTIKSSEVTFIENDLDSGAGSKSKPQNCVSAGRYSHIT